MYKYAIITKHKGTKDEINNLPVKKLKNVIDNLIEEGYEIHVS